MHCGVYPGRGTTFSNYFSYHQSLIPTIRRFPSQSSDFPPPCWARWLLVPVFPGVNQNTGVVFLSQNVRYNMVNKVQVLWATWHFCLKMLTRGLTPLQNSNIKKLNCPFTGYRQQEIGMKSRAEVHGRVALATLPVPLFMNYRPNTQGAPMNSVTRSKTNIPKQNL